MHFQRFIAVASLVLITSVVAQAQEQPPKLTSTVARAGSATSAVAASGEQRFRGVVVPNKQVEVTAPLEGMLDSLEVQEGQRVTAGQVVARMDAGMQRVVVESARLRATGEAEVRRYYLAFQEAEQMLDRIKEIHRGGAAAEWEVRRAQLQRDQAEAAHEAAKEQQELARVNLRLEEERLARYEVKAPFDGHVVRITAQAGASLTQQDRVMTLVATNPLEAWVFLPVELYGKLEMGKSYRFRAEEPINGEVLGKLKNIDPIIDTASRTFRCVFTIDNPDAAMPAGFTVHMLWQE